MYAALRTHAVPLSTGVTHTPPYAFVAMGLYGGNNKHGGITFVLYIIVFTYTIYRYNNCLFYDVLEYDSYHHFPRIN